MKLDIERWVQERREDNTLSEHKSFDAYREHKAWVLLGDPGAGKTSTFETLAEREGGTKVSASEFLDLNRPDGYPEPIFIDGLDEAAALEGKTPIGRIRSKLQQLGTPRFRLSCREADWRGSADSNALQQLVGGDKFAELHLSPLDTAQSVAFARHWLQCSEEDAQAFMEEAQRRDLDGLLANPQTLRMLTEAVGRQAHDWPASKEETYARACAKLVREQNENHLAAQRDSAPADAQLLHAAGYLCAVLLLSGSSSITIQRPATSQPHILELNELGATTSSTPSLADCRAVLRTHLFTGDALGHSVPVHRTVAEYLGARYLSQRMHEHLPANRILALLQGHDGGVVPELRGLHAWLAVLAHASVRASLIDHDPLGLVLHGDVLKFTTQEKVRLLQALQQEAARYAHFRSQNWASRPFGALATPDMQDHFRAWLQSPDRSATHQAVLDCVLDAMEHGQPMPALMPALEQVVRDKTYQSELRRSALRALCAAAKTVNDWAAPKHLLDDLHAQRIEDDRYGLAGALLKHLYPSQIPADTLWNYCTRDALALDSQQWEFWHYLVPHYAPEQDLPTLADALVKADLRMQSNGDDYTLSEVVSSLLVALTSRFGTQVDTPRLYGWLNLAMGLYHDNNLQPDTRKQLAQWFAENPWVYKQVYEYGISQMQQDPKQVRLGLYEIQNLLCEAEPPSDAADWYGLLAAQYTGELRHALIEKLIEIEQQRHGANSALERLEHWAQQHPEDSEWISTTVLQCPYPPDATRYEWINKSTQRKEKVRQEQSDEHAFLDKELPKLTSPEAHFGLLIHVGEISMDFYHRANAKTAKERLQEKLFDNPHWAEMALAGLRYFLLHRTDLPSVDDIFTLHLKSRRYNAAIPCLASMELRYADDPSTAFALEETLLEKLVAFRLTSNYGNPPAWFTQLVSANPDLVARVMLQLMRKQIAAKTEHVEGLSALAHDPQYAAIAKRITPALIEALPTKASTPQLRSVKLLVACMLRTLEHSDQLDWIENRLALSGLDVGQRVYWLTAGVQVQPALYLPQLRSYIGTNQKRAAHVYDLLYEQRQERALPTPLTLEAQAYLVELLGAQFTPAEEPRSGKAYWVTPAMDNMRFVQSLISAMAADPSKTAASALSALQQNPRLQPWGEHLQQAAYEQRLLRRKVLFQPPSVPQVCATLANLQPANAADLHALALDHLTQLAGEIRNGSTNDYSQYWNGEKPQLENDCRDRLLSDLRHLLPTGVNAEQEAPYADHKRADIKVLYGAWQIPIEIKRDAHKDLWTAIHKQLIAKYSRETSSDGYGIYIVFWFGTDYTQRAANGAPMNWPAAADGGHKPKTPQELQQRLAATVPKELQHKIAVLVIDCAKPVGQ